MSILLTNDEDFSIDVIDEHGIVAIGGDFSPGRLLKAYSLGIFPWPHCDLPILWFCPDPRFVLEPKAIIVNRSLRKIVNTTTLKVKADQDFLSVIKNCQLARRQHQEGTWITDDMVDGYYELFKQGFAHSIEAYEQDKLVGGLYGVSLGSIFFGESMFFHKSNASKICFVTLVAHLLAWNFSLIDCQAYTNHLEKFGAQPMSRTQFLSLVDKNRLNATKKGPWQFFMTPKEAVMQLNLWQGPLH